MVQRQRFQLLNVVLVLGLYPFQLKSSGYFQKGFYFLLVRTKLLTLEVTNTLEADFLYMNEQRKVEEYWVIAAHAATFVFYNIFCTLVNCTGDGTETHIHTKKTHTQRHTWNDGMKPREYGNNASLDDTFSTYKRVRQKQTKSLQNWHKGTETVVDSCWNGRWDNKDNALARFYFATPPIETQDQTQLLFYGACSVQWAFVVPAKTKLKKKKQPQKS